MWLLLHDSVTAEEKLFNMDAAFQMMATDEGFTEILFPTISFTVQEGISDIWRELSKRGR